MMNHTDSTIELEALTNQVIGAAIAVQKELGVGFLESVYQAALSIELEERGIDFETQVCVPIDYHGRNIAEHRLDLLVEDQLVVALKSVSELDKIHFSTVRSYLKATNLKHGMLINFAKIPLQVKRVIFDPSHTTFTPAVH